MNYKIIVDKEETKEYEGHILYRLKREDESGKITVGGWIGKDVIISGDSFIFNETAIVYGMSELTNSKIYNNAIIFQSSLEESYAYDNAKISNSRIYNSSVSQNAVVSSSSLKNNCRADCDSIVENSTLIDGILVTNNAQIKHSTIQGTIVFSSNTIVNTKNLPIYFKSNHRFILRDCTISREHTHLTGSRNSVIMTDDGKVFIGCQTMHIDEWLENYDIIGRRHGYSVFEIDEYLIILNFLKAKFNHIQKVKKAENENLLAAAYDEYVDDEWEDEDEWEDDDDEDEIDDDEWDENE